MMTVRSVYALTKGTTHFTRAEFPNAFALARKDYSLDRQRTVCHK
jgi:hypothetical protein